MLSAAHFSDWTAPLNLGPTVNSSAADFAPHVSKDGRSLYFASTRPGYGGEDLWVSQRAGDDEPWGTPVNLGQVINTASNQRSPALSRDGHWLFFGSDRPGGVGGLDIWVSVRTHVHDDFSWEPPVNLTTINSSSTDAGPAFFENDDNGQPQLYFASNRPGGAGGLDIWVSTLVDGIFHPPSNVVELNTDSLDLTPGLRHDGLELVLASGRPGSLGGQDLWVSTRENGSDAWSVPVHLGAVVNSPSNENFPSFSSDRRTLYFVSDRPGGSGSADLYMTTRTR
jgi:Tol biopolymer transport system component